MAMRCKIETHCLGRCENYYKSGIELYKQIPVFLNNHHDKERLKILCENLYIMGKYLFEICNHYQLNTISEHVVKLKDNCWFLKWQMRFMSF